jgi:hypothetical protein
VSFRLSSALDVVRVTERTGVAQTIRRLDRPGDPSPVATDR